MRSNDVFLGLAHDVFCFTMLQEIIARSLSVDIGTYKHMVGSLHIYETDNAKAELYLAEGWQSTGWPMPAMPAIDPWPSIDIVLEAERAIRMCAPQDEEKVHSLDPYWQDVVRLLRAYRFRKDNDAPAIVTVKAQMNSTVFDTFLDAAARNAAAI
jgi:thymidylate synthase